MSYRSVVLATPNLLDYWPLSEAGLPFLSIGPRGTPLIAGPVPGAFVPGSASQINNQPADASIYSNSGAAGGSVSSAANYNWPAAISIEAWFNPNNVVDVGGDGIAGAWLPPNSTAQGAMLLFGGAASHVYFFAGPGSLIDSGIGIPLNAAAHLVGTYDGASMRIYINGALAAGPLAGPSPASTASPFRLGNYASSGRNGIVGWIDDVSTYSRALTAAEVLAHYNAGIAPPTPPTPPQVVPRHW